MDLDAAKDCWHENPDEADARALDRLRSGFVFAVLTTEQPDFTIFLPLVTAPNVVVCAPVATQSGIRDLFYGSGSRSFTVV